MAGTSKITGNLTTTGTLNADGATTLGSTLAVTGAITATGGVVGAVDGVVGGTTPAAGTFTTLSASGAAPTFERWGSGTVDYTDSGAVVLATVPTGKIWWVSACVVSIGTGFDGTSPDLDVGKTGATAGYVDGSSHSATIASGGVIGADYADLGSDLYSSGNGTPKISQLTAGQQVIATVTPGGGGTAGAATIYYRYAELDA